jgi:hypothetical protein
MANQELGLMLKSAHDMSPDFAHGFEGLLGRMDEMVKSSDLLTTQGAVAKANAGGAWEKIQALADGMVQKSVEGGNEMTNAQAQALVLKTEVGAALYKEYMQDNPRQRGVI